MHTSEIVGHAQLAYHTTNYCDQQQLTISTIIPDNGFQWYGC